MPVREHRSWKRKEEGFGEGGREEVGEGRVAEVYWRSREDKRKEILLMS